jgi:hypothetical protein
VCTRVDARDCVARGFVFVVVFRAFAFVFPLGMSGSVARRPTTLL